MSALGSDALSDLLAALEVAEVKPSKPVDLRAAALYYTRMLHWPVLPLRPRGKTPLVARGLHDATLEAAVVCSWWDRWPEANIGLPTGPREHGGIGLDVIDADGPEGVAAWTALKHRHCPPGCSQEAFCDATGGFEVVAEAVTPGNAEISRGPGRHLYVPASGRGNTVKIGGRPLDLRGASGYVVAPPSVNLTGATYTWIKPPEVAR
jgi:hypothetical protein